MNCYDEVYPGQHENTRKIQNLLHKKIKVGDENFTEKYSKLIRELHQLMKTDYMGITKCSEREAAQYVDRFINFNHVKKYISDDGIYLSIDPIIEYKYEDKQ